jgi:putative transposase
VGEGGEEVSVAGCIAEQRTFYRVPHTLTCALLGVSPSWSSEWIGRTPTPTGQRRTELDAAVTEAVAKARGLHGSPRLRANPRGAARAVAEKTVADSMRRQGLIARRIRRWGGLTRQDKTAPKSGALLRRDFTATAPTSRWVGAMTEIPTPAGKLYRATVLDLYSRRLLGAATGRHPDAQLACEAIRMAVAARGGAGQIAGVLFHPDRGSTHTAERFTARCRRQGIRQSMGRVGCCLDNAAEALFSSPEWEVLSRHEFASAAQARAVAIDWCHGSYNHRAAAGLSPINYQTAALIRDAA